MRFCPPTEVVECLERDLLDVQDSCMDLSSAGCEVRGAVGECVVGVPSRSVVDCTRVAVIAERPSGGSKRLRLQLAGSQATTVPGNLLDVPLHVDLPATQIGLHAGGGAREDDNALPVVGAADESHLVEMEDNASTDNVDDDAESIREGSVVSEVSEAPDTLVENEIPGRDVRHTPAFRAALQSLDRVC